jgi:hypothetical protein
MYDDVWLDAFESTPTHLHLGPLEAALRYRFHDTPTGAVVSVYLFFSKLHWMADLRVDPMLVYNAAAFPSCWR